jgi:hypothetical protein
MDIRMGIIIFAAILLLGGGLSLRSSLRSIQSSRRIDNWPRRRQQIAASWRAFGIGVIMVSLGGALLFIGKPFEKREPPTQPIPTVVPSTATVKLNPTITSSPAEKSPTNTLANSATETIVTASTTPTIPSTQTTKYTNSDAHHTSNPYKFDHTIPYPHQISNPHPYLYAIIYRDKILTIFFI